jgi:hypothetical protein
MPPASDSDPSDDSDPNEGEDDEEDDEIAEIQVVERNILSTKARALVNYWLNVSLNLADAFLRVLS